MELSKYKSEESILGLKASKKLIICLSPSIPEWAAASLTKDIV